MEEKENAEECMGNLTDKTNEFDHKEIDRRSKEQFINGINDGCMMKKS